MKNHPVVHLARIKLVKSLLAIMGTGVVAVWADNFLRCSDRYTVSCNTCNNTCNAVTVCDPTTNPRDPGTVQVSGCSGWLFDWNDGLGAVHCNAGHHFCTADHAGMHGTDCFETGDPWCIRYEYHNQSPPCPPCTPTTGAWQWYTRVDTVTRVDTDCPPPE
jgi:hypothetical protein